LPLGGYVKMLDEREPGPGINPDELDQAFNRQSVFKRIAIVAAGRSRTSCWQSCCFRRYSPPA
jgi:membrane-associated protease RseP (regulator of RpoE activity)